MERTSKAHLVTFLAALLICLAVILRMVAPYFLALLLGAILAMLTYPAYKKLRARNLPPRLSAAAVTLTILVLVLGPAIGFSVMAVRQGITIGKKLAETENISPKEIVNTISRDQWLRLMANPENIRIQIVKQLQIFGNYTTYVILRMAKNIPDFLLQIALALLSCFFLLRDGKTFVRWLLSLSTLDEDVQDRLAASFHDTANSTILAGLAAGAAQAGVLMTGFLTLNVPGAFLAGALAFLFSWFPVVGTAPISIAAALYLYSQESPLKMGFMICFGVLTGVVDNFVRPMVLRGRSGMHPLVGLIAIIGGIDMFGIFGVILGPIFAAMLISLLEIWPSVGGRFGIAVNGDS